MRSREKHYASIDEFRLRETPNFDPLSDAIDGLMDAMFLDEIHRSRRDAGMLEEGPADLLEEMEWAY